MFNLDFFQWSTLMGTTLCAAPSKSYALSTNYYASIVLPTWYRCAPPILFWPWPPYSLLPRSCLTWIFFSDRHWWVPLCVQHPARAMPFQQIIMHALHSQHDVDVHLLFISPNEVFCDIMVLASPPRPPVDPDNVNTLTKKIYNLSLSNFISG